MADRCSADSGRRLLTDPHSSLGDGSIDFVANGSTVDVPGAELADFDTLEAGLEWASEA